eukprot:gene33198-42929_t
MFNFVTNITNTTAATGNPGGGSNPSSSVASGDAGSQSVIGGTSAEDIPKEELMHLCMKMNKRMQAMESKGKELVRRKATLLTERNKLLELMGTSSSLSILTDPTASTNSSFSGGDQDLDLSAIESSWLQWEADRREAALALQTKLQAKDQAMQTALSQAEGRFKREMAELQQQLSASLAVRSATEVQGDSSQDQSDTAPGQGDLYRQSAEVEALKVDLDAKSSEYENLRVQCSDLQSRLLRCEADVDRLRAAEAFLKEQAAGLEAALADKNRALDQMQKQAESATLSWEEKVVYLQMQLNGEHTALKKQLEKALTGAEESQLSTKSNKEVISALQSRLVEVEPKLAQSKDKVREQERLISAAALMKAEQDALAASLRRELKVAFEEREELLRKHREQEEFRVLSEGQLLKLAGLSEQDATSLITRLRAEAQASERNHAMRTAMLATCEAQVAQLMKEAADREESVAASASAAGALKAELEALQFSNRRESEIARQREAMEELDAQRLKAQQATIEALKAQHERETEHLKKSSMARSLLNERKEEVRHLSAKVAALNDEISSGAPSERKIFELAQSQAKREATFGLQSIGAGGSSRAMGGGPSAGTATALTRMGMTTASSPLSISSSSSVSMTPDRPMRDRDRDRGRGHRLLEGEEAAAGGPLARRVALSDSDRDLQEKLDRINTDILSIHSSTCDENEPLGLGALSPTSLSSPHASPSGLENSTRIFVLPSKSQSTKRFDKSRHSNSELVAVYRLIGNDMPPLQSS